MTEETPRPAVSPRTLHIASSAGDDAPTPCEPGGLHVPEVETLRRHLLEAMVGVRISAVEVVVPRALPGRPRAEVVDLLLNRTLSGVDRHGRTLILRIGGMRLAMPMGGKAGGAVMEAQAPPPPGARLAVEFDSRARLWFTDSGAARAALASESAPGAVLACCSGGLEPLSAAFTLMNFKRILSRKKRTLFQLLVDDELIAGIGGLYAEEILFAARLRPTRAIPSLKPEDVQLLYYAIVEVLQKAIRFRGVSVAGVPLLEGRPGIFQRLLHVHGRNGLDCQICRGRICQATVGKTRPAYCPSCQKQA